MGRPALTVCPKVKKKCFLDLGSSFAGKFDRTVASLSVWVKIKKKWRSESEAVSVSVTVTVLERPARCRILTFN